MKKQFNFIILKGDLSFKVSTDLHNLRIEPLGISHTSMVTQLLVARTQETLGRSVLLAARLSNPYVCLLQYYSNNNWVIQDVD